jgi:hypothetical protein
MERFFIYVTVSRAACSNNAPLLYNPLIFLEWTILDLRSYEPITIGGELL